MSIRPLFETLKHLRGGEFLDEAAGKLNELVAAVDDTGKEGKITIELKLKKASRGGAISIVDSVSVKLPKQQALDTLLFATPEGNLITSDPRQANLPLVQVAAASVTAAADLKRIGE